MYLSALLNFSVVIQSLTESIVGIQQFKGYYDALRTYMEVPQKMFEDEAQKIEINDFQELRFENVSFTYPGQSNPTLKNINITMQKGERLSIVGENGAGKTTFVKLLCRLYDPSEGKITIDGVDIKKIRYDCYLSLISAAFQDYKLLAFTIKENVALSQTMHEKDEYIHEIITQVGLSERIESLQQGMDTYVYHYFAEDGIALSGGEGQKLALARAMYKDAPIMILDEPTASLDPRAEYEIYQRFATMTKGKLTVFISHRMSSSKFCDHIVVFKDGSIKEYGTHAELISSNGIYADLFQMQSKYYLDF